jgi:AAA15 family ATPase/GTPase
MLNSVKLENYGPLIKLDWENLGPINLIIGDNGTGKTFLLKAIYSAVKTIEDHKKGNDQRTIAEILSDKIYWTFQADKIGDLTTKGSTDALSFFLSLDQKRFSYSFGKDTTKQISILENETDPRSSNSIFFPAKEVLSLHQIILNSREQDKLFGFDDTYLDLVKALLFSPQMGNNFKAFSNSRKKLKSIIDGRVMFDKDTQKWIFKKGKMKFPIGVTSEGIKKIAILDTLLGNRYLTPNSIIFIDEPESALHPIAISKLLDIIATLANTGIQFFLASHSYFVIKKLLLIALEQDITISVISQQNEQWIASNLKNGMPENTIIDQSIRLYEEEVELSLK